MAQKCKNDDMTARYLSSSHRVNSSTIKLFKPYSEQWVPKMLIYSIQLTLKYSIKIKVFKNMIIFRSQEKGLQVLCSTSPSKHNLKHWALHIKQTQENSEGRGEKKAGWLGILETKVKHNDEFPRFSSCLKYSRLRAGEVNLEMPISTVRKKSQDESTLSSRKGQPNKEKNVQTITTLVQPITREGGEMWPHHHLHQQRPIVEPRFQFKQGCNKAPHHPFTTGTVSKVASVIRTLISAQQS